MQPQPILHFWFEELPPKQHFVKDTALDDAIRARFGATLEVAARCELFGWRTKTPGSLGTWMPQDRRADFNTHDNR